jgi:hypothetical protein
MSAVVLALLLQVAPITLSWPAVPAVRSYVVYVGTSPGKYTRACHPGTTNAPTYQPRTSLIYWEGTPGVRYYFAIASWDQRRGALSPEQSFVATATATPPTEPILGPGLIGHVGCRPIRSEDDLGAVEEPPPFPPLPAALRVRRAR